MKVGERVRETTIGRSVWRTPPGSTPRERAARHWGSFLLHLYPVKVRRSELKLKATWFMGVVAIALMLSLIVSGIYLMFFYVPHPTTAYGNIQDIQTTVGFGQFIRNVHRWSAHLMVLVVGIHMAKVFYRGAYKPPREFNWVIGVMLLMTTLLMSFTGYLLPWDQLAYWAITVGASMAGFVPYVGDTVQEVLLGGPVVGGATLLRFYVLHVAVLPTVMVSLVVIHLWRWRKDRMFSDGAGPTPTAPVSLDGHRVLGIVPGVPGVGERKVPLDDDEVLTSPHLLIRHAVASLVALLIVLALALSFDAPLRAIANPNETPNPEKAPWYFAGLQELLSHLHPLVAGILVPATLALGLLSVPYLDRNPEKALERRRVAVWTFSLLLIGWIILTLIGFAFRGPGWRWVWPWDEWHGEL